MPPRRDLTRTTFAVLSLTALVGVSLWILRIFIGPAIWATMFVVASWPLMLRVERRLGHRVGAVALMTALLLLVFMLPLLVAVGTIVGNADELVGWARALASFRMPAAPPASIAGLPYVGAKLSALWQQLAASGIDGLLARLQPYAGQVTRWFIGQVGGLGFLLLQLALTIGIAMVMYSRGERYASHVRRFAYRLAGERGVETVALAGDAIRGVAIGIGATALAQSAVSGLALVIAGVPLAGLLIAVVFMLCLVQVGPMPVLLTAAAWSFWGGATGWGVFLLVVSAIVGTLDNVLRPMLMRLGADLPMLLTFAGAVGGLFAFGLVGIIVGPVVLAVAYTLLASWVDEAPPPPELPPPAAPR
jgi:predicted PurR-regulated permease PerM